MATAAWLVMSQRVGSYTGYEETWQRSRDAARNGYDAEVRSTISFMAMRGVFLAHLTRWQSLAGLAVRSVVLNNVI